MEPIASSDPASEAPATSGPCHTCHAKLKDFMTRHTMSASMSWRLKDATLHNLHVDILRKCACKW